MKDVGVRIKVGSTGLEKIEQLSAELKAAGVSTEALDGKAAELGAQLKRLTQQQELIDTFKRQKASVEQAATALQDAKDKAGALARELKTTEEPTKKQQTAFEKARQAARDASDAFDAQRVKLQQLRASMADAGVSTDTLAKAQVRIRQESAEVREGLQRLESAYSQTAQGAVQSAGVQVRAAGQVKDGLSDLGRQLSLVRNLAQAAIGGQLLGGLTGDLTKTADAYTNLGARIRLVTGEGAAFDAAFQGVFDVATRTNSAVESTGQLFTRLAQAGKSLGVSQAEALALTETINQAIQLSGASAASSDAAITQLVQGLQGGVLRGDEFNSVMEQAPRLAQALADGLGVTTGELRKMAEAGRLSSEVVVEALRGQGKTLNEEFGKLPQTVGRALQNLSTEWTRYVGEVDKANGISTAAASAINALASNLDTLGTLLTTAGKAAAAYAALRLGAYFRDKAVAIAASATALGTETAALATNTAATTGNTAAKTANAVAARAAAAATATAATAATAATSAIAGAGTAAAAAAAGGLTALRAAGARVLGLLGPIGAAVAGISLAWDAIKGVGTWLGETAAKLAGAKDRTEELAAATRASAKAAQDEATARAAQAQETALAAERALGLSTAARALVTDFDQMRDKGTGAAEAVAKLAKDIDLGTPQGINDAVAALDELERQGKLTGPAVREALRQALDGQDLGNFEVQARAAFGSTEQGARRLGLALDAMQAESLARVGTSVQELESGFSSAFNSAVNDTDVLALTLRSMGIEADRAGPLLAKALDKEIEAATTEKALRLLEGRLLSMGRSGDISGDQVSAGLDKVRKKADEILPGINSVGEAAAKLGVKTKAELERTATDFKASWDKISQSAEVSLAEKIKAFERYRDAAIAANGGVESAEVALIRKTLEAQAAAAGLGDAFERAATRGKRGIDDATKSVVALGNALGAIDEEPLRKKFFADAQGNTDKSRGFTYGQDGFAQQNGGRFTAGGQLTPPDSSGDWEFVGDVRANNLNVPAGAVAVNGQGYWKRRSGPSGGSQPAALGRAGAATGPGSLGSAGGATGAGSLGGDAAARAAVANQNAGTTGLSAQAANLGVWAAVICRARTVARLPTRRGRFARS